MLSDEGVQFLDFLFLLGIELFEDVHFLDELVDICSEVDDHIAVCHPW
jgi:hypothetical protein